MFSLRQIVITLLLAIGLSAGTIAYLMTRLIGSMSDLKWGWVQESVDEGKLVEGWLKLIGFCVPLTLFAALMTYFCPDAAGSGIPYVKSYLNGNGLKLASFSTLFTKVVGISCMVICGVPVGREGPMVHWARWSPRCSPACGPTLCTGTCASPRRAGPSTAVGRLESIDDAPQEQRAAPRGRPAATTTTVTGATS